LRAYRLAHGITQAHVARCLGVSREHLRQMELGVRNVRMSEERRAKYAAAVGLEVTK